MDYEKLGKRLREVREVFKMSQAEVATQLGVTQTHITRLENGKGTNGDFLVQSLSYYSQFISLDRLFNDGLPILEAVQEELKSPSGEILRRRNLQMTESINRMIDAQRETMLASIDNMQKQFNARMDVIITDNTKGQ